MEAQSFFRGRDWNCWRLLLHPCAGGGDEHDTGDDDEGGDDFEGLERLAADEAGQ